MTSEGVVYERRSAAPVVAPVRPRKLAKVPFVELAEGRLQGVVSSGSDTTTGSSWIMPDRARNMHFTTGAAALALDRLESGTLPT